MTKLAWLKNRGCLTNAKLLPQMAEIGRRKGGKKGSYSLNLHRRQEIVTIFEIGRCAAQTFYLF